MGIGELRKRIGLKRVSLAESMGVSLPTINQWDKAKSIPHLSPAQYKELIRLLECTPQELADCFGEPEEPFMSPSQYLAIMQATGCTVDTFTSAFSSEIPRESRPSPHTRRRVTKTSPTKQTSTTVKKYVIAHPDGTIEVISNLNAFCREHNLYANQLLRVARNAQNSYKGYRCYRLDMDREYTPDELINIVKNRGVLSPDAQQLAS